MRTYARACFWEVERAEGVGLFDAQRDIIVLFDGRNAPASQVSL